MELQNEIENYLEANSGKSTSDVISFLIKLWNSAVLKSPAKFDVILKCFTNNLLPKALGEDEGCVEELRRFFKLRYLPGCVSVETKIELSQKLSAALKKNPSETSISLCLELVSNDSFKDFFKTHIDNYCDLLHSIIHGYSKIIQEQGNSELFMNIVAELFCFAKLENFKEMFIARLLVPLSNLASNLTEEEKSAVWDLHKSFFFSTLTTSEPSLEVFERELSQEQLQTLTETYVAINKSKADQIVRLLTLVYDKILKGCDDDSKFLSQMKRIFLLLKTHEVELAPLKRQEPGFFKRLAERINNSVEVAKQSMDFAEFLEALSSFVSCDAFLLEKNIFQIVMDCMLREKTESELKNYGTLLSVVIKIYGKDMDQFIRKLLKSIEETLESFTIPKKRKRKLLSGSEAGVTPKKQKLIDGSSENAGEIANAPSIWPAATTEQFAEAFSGLNVSQTLKVWKQFNNFLVQVLQQLKELSSMNENVLFKIDFASNLLCGLFDNTRLQEQLMYKQAEIASMAKEFNETQRAFYEIIMNIEYNSRFMNAFLKISLSYESFLSLFFYHHNSYEEGELESLFIGEQSRAKSEWEIIQQRIKNFGKTDDKNNLNALVLQQHRNAGLFSAFEVKTEEDFLPILADEKQVEFLLLNADTRAFFINSLGKKELKLFAQYLQRVEDKEVLTSAVNVIAQNQALLDGFTAKLFVSAEDDVLESILDILNRLPLACSSDANKKLIFQEILNKKPTKELEPLVKSIIGNLFKGDSYKTFFTDFTIESVVEVFKDVEGYSCVYEAILSNAARKMNADTMVNLEWIVSSGNSKLISILAKIVTEIPMTPASGTTVAAINKLKIDLIAKLMASFSNNDLKKFSEKTCKEFVVLAGLCSENSAALNDETKTKYSELLQKTIKIPVKSVNKERAKLLMVTLKDAKKFNLNDETKGSIVDTLLAYLKSLLVEKISSEVVAYSDVEQEKQLFAALKPFKSNFQDSCVETLRYALEKTTSDATCGQLQYSLKIYQLALNTADKSSSGVIKSYLKFFSDIVPRALRLDSAEVIIEILETNNVVLKENKFKLEATSIDELFCLLTEPRIKPSTFDLKDFCNFFSAVGETLFVIANVRQNYFKSRISQFFNAYKVFMESVYFYKNDQPGEHSQMETSMLLKLALQLENIMKMVEKNHAASINVISLYVASAVVNVLAKNPKTLSTGYKFKVNIKNICNQLLSTFDDNTRKHVYSVADETTRDIYDGLFSDIRRKP